MNLQDEASVLKQFGSSLKKIRRSKRLTQQELAERVALHRTYIGGIERGERNVSLLNILNLADALECDVAALFTCFNRKGHQ